MIKMKTNFYCIFFFSLFTLSCSKKEKSVRNKDFDYNKGKITIVTDDSFKSVASALADAYMINYPETKVDVSVKKEDFAFIDLLNNKSKLIIMSRNLSSAEEKEYERMVDMKMQPAYFAADAVVFVVPKNSSRTQISVDDIERELKSDAKNLIFDGTNSGNLNFVAQKFDEKPSDLKFSTISGNANVIKELAQYPDKIGVVSLNTISRPYGEEAKKLRDLVKILPVTEKNKTFEPSNENLNQNKYPFTRILYFLTNEGNFGIANGIIRFSCMQIGQIVVAKEGLQPYNIFKREVEMR